MSTACAHFCACDSSAELSRNEHGTLIADGSGQPPPCSRGLQAVEHTILPVRVISATPIGSRRRYRAAARCSVPHWLRQVACHPPKNSNLRGSRVLSLKVCHFGNYLRRKTLVCNRRSGDRVFDRGLRTTDERMPQ